MRNKLLRWDPTYVEDPLALEIAIIVLASAYLGADEERIAAATMVPVDLARTVGARLRTAGIWVGDLVDDPFAAGPTLDAAFACAVLVAEGRIEWTGKCRSGRRVYVAAG